MFLDSDFHQPELWRLVHQGEWSTSPPIPVCPHPGPTCLPSCSQSGSGSVCHPPIGGLPAFRTSSPAERQPPLDAWDSLLSFASKGGGGNLQIPSLLPSRL